VGRELLFDRSLLVLSLQNGFQDSSDHSGCRCVLLGIIPCCFSSSYDCLQDRARDKLSPWPSAETTLWRFSLVAKRPLILFAKRWRRREEL